MRRAWPILLVALLVGAGALPSRAQGLSQEMVLWIAPVPAGVKADALPGLLTLPEAWSVGDAAALLLVDRAAAPPAHARLRAGLLAEGAAVLQLDPRQMPGPCREAPLPWLAGGARQLQEGLGAGLLVVLGFDCAGEAALRAASETMSPLLAAAVALGEYGAVFAAGPAPAPDQGWALRAPLFCGAVAAALGPATGEAALGECLLALLRPAARFAWLR